MDAGVGQLRLREQRTQPVSGDVVLQQAPRRQRDAQIVHGGLHAEEVMVEHRPGNCAGTSTLASANQRGQ